MESKFDFLAEQEFDEPLIDSFAVRIHFLYLWKDAREFLFQNYKEAISQVEKNPNNIIKEMENSLLRHVDKVWKYTEEWKYEMYSTYWEVISETELWDWKTYVIADIHLDILDQQWIDFYVIEKFIQQFINNLNKSKLVEFVWVFRDDWQLVNYKMIYEQIYKIEMRYREFVSEIFLKRYYPEKDNLIYGLWKDKVKRIMKRIDKNDECADVKFKKIREKNENIFFYLLFSDYSHLLELIDLENSSKELNNILKSSENLDNWKKTAFTWITNDWDINFLESTKQDLLNLETVRNSIMHYRLLTEEDLRKYSISRENLLKQFSLFEEWEDGLYLWLVVGKYYEVRMPVWDFEVWKKYKLKYWDGNDAIFITDEWKEVRFADKEVSEYFKI